MAKKKTGPKKKKKQGDKPTFTKTYVPVAQFDGEHGLAGGGKSAPGKSEEKTQKPERKNSSEITQEEVLRRFATGEIGSELITSSLYGAQRRLKISVNGAKLREGSDIVKPITKATVYRTPQNINHLANPGILKAAPKMEKKTYQWEKPSWAQGPKLKSTSVGAAVKAGADLQAPITARVIADAQAATAANQKLRFGGTARTQSSNSIGSRGSDGGDAPPSWAQGGNGLRKASGHSQSSSDGEDKAAPQRPQLRSNDPEAERRRRQEMLARVAKSWQ